MPSPTYEKNKTHIYNWRSKNKDKVSIINNRCRRNLYAFNKQAQLLRNILISFNI